MKLNKIAVPKSEILNTHRTKKTGYRSQPEGLPLAKSGGKCAIKINNNNGP